MVETPSVSTRKFPLEGISTMRGCTGHDKQVVHEDDQHAVSASLVNPLARLKCGDQKAWSRSLNSLADDLTIKSGFQLRTCQWNLKEAVSRKHMVSTVNFEQICKACKPKTGIRIPRLTGNRDDGGFAVDLGY